MRICCDCCDLGLLYFVPGLYENYCFSVCLNLTLVLFEMFVLCLDAAKEEFPCDVQPYGQ